VECFPKIVGSGSKKHCNGIDIGAWEVLFEPFKDLQSTFMDELKMDLEPRRGIKATAKPFSNFRERRQHKRHKKLLGALKRHQAGRSRTTLTRRHRHAGKRLKIDEMAAGQHTPGGQPPRQLF
jgi:hypothetical protein